MVGDSQVALNACPECMKSVSSVFSLEKRLHSADQAGNSQPLRLLFAARLIFTVGNNQRFSLIVLKSHAKHTISYKIPASEPGTTIATSSAANQSSD